MPISESTVTNNNAPSHKTTGEDQPEDKGQGDNPNITPPMPLLQ